MVKVVRRLRFDEALKRLKDFEGRYGYSFDEFERRFLDGRLAVENLETYMEWASLVHAYRAYIEGGEMDCVTEETIEVNGRDFERNLTHKRLELLAFMASKRVESINDLARKAGRNVKNVHSDLKALEKLGFIQFRKVGDRNLIPEALIEEVTLILR